jgi:hypothetical protein
MIRFFSAIIPHFQMAKSRQVPIDASRFEVVEQVQ